MNYDLSYHDMNDHFTNNGGLTIHSIHIPVEVSTSAPFIGNVLQRAPLVILPGMCEDAEQYARLFGRGAVRDCIFVNIRGRGQSTAPINGYDFDAQLSDVEAVIDGYSLERCILIGFSIGASFALGYARRHPDRVAGLVLYDYPPHYPLFPDTWVTETLASHPGMPEHVIRQLAAESERTLLDPRDITCPALVIRATDGALPENLEHLYTGRMRCCTLAVLQSGHELTDAGSFLSILHSWLHLVD